MKSCLIFSGKHETIKIFANIKVIMSTFSDFNLDPRIYKAISSCGYKQPTPIQAKSIPLLLNGDDLIGSSQTGTGKTATFLLPALQRLSNSRASSKARVLILTPTRELAAQITRATRAYGKFLKLNIVDIVGGVPYPQQIKMLSQKVDIIIATPGRLLDHMKSRRLDLSEIEMFILDEADRMLDMGFIDDVKLIAKSTPRKRQTVLFSATFDNSLQNEVKYLLNQPKQVDVALQKTDTNLITQHLYIADSIKHKKLLLEHLIKSENIYKAIIFTATKRGAESLASELKEKGYSSYPLHGDLKQNLRNKTITRLRKGEIQFVIATDVIARGIDITDISHVINFDLPKFSEDYVHRIGRTGRAGRTGIAISFALPDDYDYLQKIERFTAQKLQTMMIEGLEPKKQFEIKQVKKKPFKKKHYRSKPKIQGKPKAKDKSRN